MSKESLFVRIPAPLGRGVCQESHNQQVIDYFQNKPDKLLIICWEKGDSWDKLCNFLGKTVPEIPLPHLMKS